MKLKKDLIIVALATFCLTATVFMIRPTLSNPGLGEYDAWNDLNGDGIIDMYDAIQFAGTFNTAGDPTKNVKVTEIHNETWDPYWKVIHIVENMPITVAPDGQILVLNLGTIATAGYSRMTVYASIVNQTRLLNLENVEITLWLNSTFDFGSTNQMTWISPLIQWNNNVNKPTGNPIVVSWPGSGVTFAMDAPLYTLTLRVAYQNPTPGLFVSCQFSLGVYLRNE
jgi:hypothetical protein